MSEVSKKTSILQNSLDAIQPTNTLLNSSVINTICQTVQKNFSGVDLNSHGSDPNLILYIANLIEIAFPNSKTNKINKKDILVKCLNNLGILTDYEAVSRVIEFLHSSNQIKEIIKEAKPILKKFINFLRIIF
jgi:hypothetical protein